MRIRLAELFHCQRVAGIDDEAQNFYSFAYRLCRRRFDGSHNRLTRARTFNHASVSFQVFGFENFSSSEFHLHLNRTQQQGYLSLFSLDNSFDEDNNNIILRVAVGAMVYLALYLTQRLYNFLIYERFVDNCLQQFIDVSSIANISVLILLDSYGYYIHGRSG